MRMTLAVILALGCGETDGQVKIQRAGGWYESAYVEWENSDLYESYNVYYRKADGEYAQIANKISGGDETSEAARMGIVRDYKSYGRADLIGVAAGEYQFRVVPVADGKEVEKDAEETETVDVVAHDRSGFAHQGMTEGIGAYNNDGTLKENAKVIYVTGDNAKSVTSDVTTSSKGGTTTAKGLQDIIYYYQKGYDTTPLAIRIIGTIESGEMDRFDSSAEGLQIKGRTDYSTLNITLEGVGEDATIRGFGILCRNANSVEFRNFAIMSCMDDALSIDTKNSHIWAHNLDFYYGQPGSAKDQAKGDGTFDVKGKSTYITLSYCHFVDNGKSSLGGMKSETTDSYLTYHHNWFDHSDSRHPRIRTMSFHIYNNYYDGNSKYGVGMTYGGSAFVERNYFRGCKYPMLISMQGTDAMGDGTFSGENGGVIKSMGNSINGAKRYVAYTAANASTYDWDAYEVETAGERVPEEVTCKQGGTSYNNFDTDGALTYRYKADDAEEVPEIVTGAMGAGRMNHGDFSWKFDNAKEDSNDAVIAGLNDAIKEYQSAFSGFYGETANPIKAPELTDEEMNAGRDNTAYDLSGRRVGDNSRGIVVKNGKKSVRK